MPRKLPGQPSISRSRRQATTPADAPFSVETRLAGARDVPIDQVSPDPEQPRRSTDPEALEELARSIRDHGILQPLLVRTADGPDDLLRYIIIAGGRRYDAARKARLERLPVIVREEADPSDLRALQLIENIQREALDVVQEAAALRELMELRGLTHRQVAEVVGRSHNYVQRRLDLLFDERIVDAVRKGRVSASTAAEMKTLPAPVRDDVVTRVAAGESLEVGDLRRLKREVRPQPQPSQTRSEAGGGGMIHSTERAPLEPPAAPSADAGAGMNHSTSSREGAAIEMPVLRADRRTGPGLSQIRMVTEHELEVVSLLRTGDGRAPQDEVVAALERDLERLRRA